MKKSLLSFIMLSLSYYYGFSQIITTSTYNYTGEYDSLIVGCSSIVQFTVYGSKGVNSDAVNGVFGSGGLGAIAQGEVQVNTGDILYFFVGGQSGFNGGAEPGGPGINIGGSPIYYSGRGGDASDIRLNGTALTDRIIVAAGGGGGSAGPQGSCVGSSGGNGGNGGDTFFGNDGTLGAGCGSGGSGGTGGTSVSGGIGGVGNLNCSETGDTGINGLLGLGGSGGNGKIGCDGYTGSGGGGGGGGYFGGAGGGGGSGGSGGAWQGGGGGGGSSYIGGVTNGSVISGSNTGLGYIVVTYTNSTASTISVSACDSYISPSGIYTWTTNGTYNDTVSNSFGCDSIITVNLSINNSTNSTDIQSACDSYTWIDGNTYTASTNSAQFSLPNSVGCDSIITLNLTINQATNATDVQSACDSYTWIDGITYTASTNTAQFVLPNAAGCDSTINLNLTIQLNTIDTTILMNGAMLTANQTGAIYQWFDCETNAPIAGETAQSFFASENGNYAVEITNGICSVTSACETISVIGITELEITPFVSVYPNPTSGIFAISTTLENAVASIYSADGKLISGGILLSENDKILDILQGAEQGIYLIVVSNESVKYTTRISVK